MNLAWLEQKRKPRLEIRQLGRMIIIKLVEYLS